MSSTDEIEKQPYIQRGALQLILFVFLVSLFVYIANFSWPFNEMKGLLSGNTGTWGEFGDYLGGVVNPIVGLITIWLLTTSLKQSQLEMELTRQALIDAEKSQKATEAALQEQIKVAQQARDMNNTIALWDKLNSRSLNVQQIINERNHRGVASEAEQKELKALQESLVAMGIIMESEIDRLREKHFSNN